MKILNNRFLLSHFAHKPEFKALSILGKILLSPKKFYTLMIEKIL